MKSRFVFSAFCMLVAMTMATGAFAQATFQVSAGATQGRMNGHTEEAGGITLAVTSGTIDRRLADRREWDGAHRLRRPDYECSW